MTDGTGKQAMDSLVDTFTDVSFVAGSTMDEAVEHINSSVKCVLIVTGAIGIDFIPRVVDMD